MSREEREEMRIAIERALEAARQQQESEGQMDIFEQIDTIPVVREFALASSAIPAMQRVQTFLAECFGPLWFSASVQSYCAANGTTIHVALAPYAPGKQVLEVVSEALDGNLAVAAILPSSQDQWDELASLEISAVTTQPPERDPALCKDEMCLQAILPALTECSNIIAASEDIKPRRKKRLRSQIAHAARHLSANLDRMRQQS